MTIFMTGGAFQGHRNCSRSYVNILIQQWFIDSIIGQGRSVVISFFGDKTNVASLLFDGGTGNKQDAFTSSLNLSCFIECFLKQIFIGVHENANVRRNIFCGNIKLTLKDATLAI